MTRPRPVIGVWVALCDARGGVVFPGGVALNYSPIRQNEGRTMSFSEAVAAVQASLEQQSDVVVRRVVRDTHAMRTDEDGIPAIRLAGARVLGARFQEAWETRPPGELVEYVRTMPHVQTDPVVRCEADAVQRILCDRYPSVDDEAFTSWQATHGNSDPDGVSWPGYLAGAYVAAGACR